MCSSDLPFWFYRGNDALDIDKKRLGERVFKQYPANSFLKKGIKILFSSDSPVTIDYDPLKGIQRACFNDSTKESISLIEALKAFQCGSYNDAPDFFKIGDQADFIVLDGDFTFNDLPKLEMFYINGEPVVKNNL